MLQGCHGLFRRVRKRGQCRGASERAVVVARQREAACRVHAGGAAPGIVTTPPEMPRVFDRVVVADRGDVAIVLEIVGVAVALAARVKCHKRVLREEQFAAVSPRQRQVCGRSTCSRSCDGHLASFVPSPGDNAPRYQTGSPNRCSRGWREPHASATQSPAE